MIHTIGYEGRALEELVVVLRAAKIERVVDVRALPLSRRRGFSKTPLAAALAEAGIAYVHLREAGNPFRKDPVALARFDALVARSPEIVEAVRAAVKGARSALLCMEREPEACHRTILARALGGKIVAL